MYKIKRTVNKVMMLCIIWPAYVCICSYTRLFVYECIPVYSYITDRSVYCCLYVLIGMIVGRRVFFFLFSFCFACFADH